MKRTFLKQSIAILILAMFLLCITALTAAAAPDGGDTDGDSGYTDNNPADTGDGSDTGDDGAITADDPDGGDTGQGEDMPQDVPVDTPDDDPADTGDQDTPDDADTDTGEDTDDTYEDADDDEPYTTNEHAGELASVRSDEVEEATAEVLPDVDVSDATLFSGIVMWLCVAVGIAVVAGVMVSQRTHRRGG